MSTVTSTSPLRCHYPLVRAEDVQIGVYLADYTARRLYCVVDVRVRRRERRMTGTRIAMLEDTVTEEIEPWEFGDLAGLRLVRHTDG